VGAGEPGCAVAGFACKMRVRHPACTVARPQVMPVRRAKQAPPAQRASHKQKRVHAAALRVAAQLNVHSRCTGAMPRCNVRSVCPVTPYDVLSRERVRCVQSYICRLRRHPQASCPRQSRNVMSQYRVGERGEVGGGKRWGRGRCVVVVGGVWWGGVGNGGQEEAW